MFGINKDKVCKAIYASNPIDKQEKVHKALDFGKYILTSGKFSVFFIDHRAIMAEPKNANKIVEELKYLTEQSGADHVISSADAGIYWGGVVANKAGLPFSVMRKDKDVNGINKHMGVIPRHVDKVVPVDDLNTTLGTVNKVAKMVNSLGYNVKDFVLSIDREEYTPENEAEFKKQDITLHPAVKGLELIEYGFENGLIGNEKVDLVESYRKNPDEFALKIIQEYPKWVIKNKRLDNAWNYYEKNNKIRDALEEIISGGSVKEKSNKI